MIAIREIWWSPFFAGLNQDQIQVIAKASQEFQVEEGYVFFEEGDNLDRFFLVKEGTVDIILEIPDLNQNHLFAKQLGRKFKTGYVTLSTIQKGEIFGWSALVEPYSSTASAKVSSATCTVIVVDCLVLRLAFKDDYGFAYQMLLKVAQTIRSRLRDKQIEVMSIVTM